MKTIGKTKKLAATVKFTDEPFFSYNNAEQLVFEALGSYHKVEQWHFGGNFGQVVRIAQFCRNVKPEVFAVLDDGFSETNHFDATCT